MGLSPNISRFDTHRSEFPFTLIHLGYISLWLDAAGVGVSFCQHIIIFLIFSQMVLVWKQSLVVEYL